jgi:HK97 family phage major capsid protein
VKTTVKDRKGNTYEVDDTPINGDIQRVHDRVREAEQAGKPAAERRSTTGAPTEQERIPTAAECWVEGSDADTITMRARDARSRHLDAIEAVYDAVEDAGRTEPLASEQRRINAHRRAVADLDALIQNPNAKPTPEPAQVRGGRVVATAPSGEVRYGRPLPAGRSLTDLTGGSTPDEAGAYLRDLLFDRVDKRALGEGVGAAGGFAVPEPHAAVILELARKQARAIQAGVSVVPMDSKTLTVAKLETDPVPQWIGESVQIPESDPTFGEMVFDAKALKVLIRLSRELIEDAAGVEAALTNALAEAYALELDRVALYGAGTATEPRGIINTAGVNVVTLGTGNGGNITWRDVARAYQRVAIANYTPTGTLLHPRTETDLDLQTDADGNFVQPPAIVTAIPRYPTTQVITGRAVGTSTDTSDLVTGDLSKVAIGLRTSFSVLPLRERYAEFGQVAFVGWLRADVQISRPNAVQVVRGITPAA